MMVMAMAMLMVMVCDGDGDGDNDMVIVVMMVMAMVIRETEVMARRGSDDRRVLLPLLLINALLVLIIPDHLPGLQPDHLPYADNNKEEMGN